MISFNERCRINADAQQTKLSNDGCKKNEFKFRENSVKLTWDMIVTCPFCLNHNPVHRFKKAHGLYICPFCNNSMWGKSLITDLSTDDKVRELAEWVFDYRLNGFFQKIKPDFEAWNKRLFELKISFVFWEKYKSLRGDISQDNEVMNDE